LNRDGGGDGTGGGGADKGGEQNGGGGSRSLPLSRTQQYAAGAILAVLFLFGVYKVASGFGGPGTPTPTRAAVASTATATNTSRQVVAATETPTQAPTPTPTPGPTPTPVPTPTPLPTPTPVRTPTPIPTAVSTATPAAIQRLESHFAFIQAKNCSIQPNDQGKDALVECDAQQGTVYFSEFNSINDLDSLYQYIKANYRTTESTWHYQSDPETPVGEMLQFTDENGHARLFWTLDQPLMSGEAIANDNDHTALLDWWTNVLSVHP